MTASSVPTLVVAGLFDPSVSVLPLTQQAMVPCPNEHVEIDGEIYDTLGFLVDPCDGVVSFVSGPIHIAHQCPECVDGSIYVEVGSQPDDPETDYIECVTCGGSEATGLGSGWVVRSAQAEQVTQHHTGDWQNDYKGDTYELRLSGVSSETSPYLGDVTAGWHA